MRDVIEQYSQGHLNLMVRIKELQRRWARAPWAIGVHSRWLGRGTLPSHSSGTSSASRPHRAAGRPPCLPPAAPPRSEEGQALPGAHPLPGPESCPRAARLRPPVLDLEPAALTSGRRQRPASNLASLFPGKQRGPWGPAWAQTTGPSMMG